LKHGASLADHRRARETIRRTIGDDDGALGYATFESGANVGITMTEAAVAELDLRSARRDQLN
jgi:hypothetical protein